MKMYGKLVIFLTGVNLKSAPFTVRLTMDCNTNIDVQSKQLKCYIN